MLGGCPLLVVTVIVRLLSFLAEALTEDGIPGWPPDQYRTEPFIVIAERCKQNSTVTDEQVRQFVSTSVMFDDDMAFKCYAYCTWREHGVIMENGKLDRGKLLSSIESLDPESQLIMLNMGKRCLAQKERNLCDRMYGVLRCMKESDPEHFFLS